MKPYKTTEIFDQNTAPQGLLRQHFTKKGVWGIIRVYEGDLKLVYTGSSREMILSPSVAGLIVPLEKHYIHFTGSVRFCVEFYNQDPKSSL
ncbi:DUF1971 domain-containing protein [Gluconobacter sp. OJA]|uniref:DUF1971 domain-containing protein n=1 Tax=Gluconobacter sp. OJA TaxID=3145197 RepID=UPI0031FA5869